MPTLQFHSLSPVTVPRPPLARLLVLMFATATLALSARVVDAQSGAPQASDQAQSDQQSGITLHASRIVKHKTVSTDYMGIPIEQLELTRTVGFRDLDLKSPAGQARLRARIRHTAKEACMQLGSLYPLELWTTSNQGCVADATKRAMAQMPEAVAVSERQHGATPE